MKRALLLLFVCSSFLAKAQSYHPMLGDSVTWKYFGYGQIGPFYDFYSTGNDTSIGSFTYKHIIPHYSYESYLREDTVARKVYANVNGTDQIIYDFSLNLNDSVYLHWVDGSFGPCGMNGYYTADSVAITNTIGGPRKYLRLHQNSYSYNSMQWLEGVGMLDQFVNYPITYCDMLDCYVSNTPYCQVRAGINTYERGPLYSCDSGLIYDCSTHVTTVHNDSNYVFSVHVNGIGPYTYTWQCDVIDSLNNYHVIDSSFYPNAHFILQPNIHYYINVIAKDTSGCNAGGGAYVFDTIPSVASNCRAFFWIYPNTQPGDYSAQNLSTGSNLTYAWDFGDGSTSNLALPTHQYNTAGTYTICLSVNDGNGCTSTYCDSTFYNYKFGGGPISSLNVVATAITETDKEKGITLYPNPASDAVSIYIASAERPANISVYDIGGKVVAVPSQKTVQGYSLNTAVLAPGMYAIVLNFGNSKVVKRFIKN